ncbi:excisionase [Methylocystis sp. JAN1]|uniref:excisionase n=1 Tax=Methylocystis sp. JAN1 TaxID=3397211 RepID=UPI003FA2B097
MFGQNPDGEIGPDIPLRLADAVRVAFPMGGMTVSGLRREAARGRLVIMRIAGKDWVTLDAIREMMDKCRVEAGAPICGAAGIGKALRPPSGSSSLEDAKLAAQATAKRIIEEAKAERAHQRARAENGGGPEVRLKKPSV